MLKRLLLALAASAFAAPALAFPVTVENCGRTLTFDHAPERAVVHDLHLSEMAFALPDERREMKLVRYANWRINRVVNAEDTWLIERVQQGMASHSYTAGPIGASEVCLRSFAKKIRNLIPEARQHRAPAPGWSRRPREVQ